MTKQLRIIFFLFVLFVLSTTCYAGDPHDYDPHSQGLYFSAYPSYRHATLVDKNGDRTNVSLNEKLLKLCLTYFNDTPTKWAVDALVPVGEKKMYGQTSSGMGDLMLAAGLWPVEVPVSILVGSFLILPTGEFDKNKRTNLGSHVYQVIPFVGFTKAGKQYHVEVAFQYSISTKEPETGVKAGDKILMKNYAGMYVRPNLLVGLTVDAVSGKDRSVNGVNSANTAPQAITAGPSIYYVWKEKKLGINLDVLKDFEVKNSTKGYQFLARIARKF